MKNIMIGVILCCLSMFTLPDYGDAAMQRIFTKEVIAGLYIPSCAIGASRQASIQQQKSECNNIKIEYLVVRLRKNQDESQEGDSKSKEKFIDFMMQEVFSKCVSRKTFQDVEGHWVEVVCLESLPEAS